MSNITSEQKRLAFINRQPSLHRHSCPGVIIEPCDDDEEVIRISPLLIEPMNADFDGDTEALYIIHDIDALKELEEKAFIRNSIHYDANNSFLATIRHEALYAAFVLTKEKFKAEKIICEINDLKDLPESLESWNNDLDSAVNFDNKLYSYGICLFNKWCGFNKIIINESITKKKINYVSEQIYLYNNKDNKKYYDDLTELERRLFFFIASTDHSPSLDVGDMISLKDETISEMLKNLPNNNVLLGYHLSEAIVDKCVSRMDENSRFYKLFKSGSRFSKVQLARSCIVIGYSADADNVVISKPIKTSLLEGLTEEQFFRVSPGTRKSIKDKSRHTPDSGYLERTLVMALSMIEFDLDDCETDKHLDILVSSSSHAETLVGKFYRDPNSTDREWKELDLSTAKKYINNKIEIRSPMTCENPGVKICRKCFGTKTTKSEYIGIVAAQVLTERLTQLTLRTFHESGRANLSTNSEIIKYFEKHLTNIETRYDDVENKEYTRLTFDNNEFPIALTSGQEIKGLIYIDDTNNQLIFEEDNSIIKNNDVVSIMEKVNKTGLKSGRVTTHPVEYYQDMMAALLEVGTIYSSYIEILFANMFLADYDNKIYWRHRQDLAATIKLGDKVMASYISPRQGLLYQPNKKTIEQIDLGELGDDTELSIHERIWLGKI